MSAIAANVLRRGGLLVIASLLSSACAIPGMEGGIASPPAPADRQQATGERTTAPAEQPGAQDDTGDEAVSPATATTAAGGAAESSLSPTVEPIPISI